MHLVCCFHSSNQRHSEAELHIWDTLNGGASTAPLWLGLRGGGAAVEGVAGLRFAAGIQNPPSIPNTHSHKTPCNFMHIDAVPNHRGAKG